MITDTALMSFILFRLAFAFMLLFTISLAALRARTVDEAELRALLLASPACPAPCFMDVRPGETEGGTAMAMIAHHAWTVNELTSSPSTTSTPTTLCGSGVERSQQAWMNVGKGNYGFIKNRWLP